MYCPSKGTTVQGSSENKGYLEINKTVISQYSTGEVYILYMYT